MSDTEQFVGLLGNELDKTKTDINLLYTIYDPSVVSNEMLNILASMLNYDMTTLGDDYFHRNNIRTLIELYQTKGTLQSFRDLVQALGYQVELIPLWTANDPVVERRAL
jgi:phage tail P2-like protein